MIDNLRTVLITTITTIFILAIAGLANNGTLAMPDIGSGAPTMVSYQGRVILEGVPYNGNGYFKFTVVDRSDNPIWTNDGSGEDEPLDSVRLDVVNGLFNVILGDTEVTNMVELEAYVFDETERYLRVWFSPNGDEFLMLTPDQRIAAVPYALQAEEAAQAGNADTVDGEHANAFADAAHNHTPGNINPQGAGSGLDADLLDGEHASDLELPTGAMVLGATDNETTLITAGFTYTGRVLGNIWATKSAMPIGRLGLAAAAVDGIIYAIGGYNGIYPEVNEANEAYDPVTDTWTTKSDMPTGRFGLAAAVVDGIIYAIGGSSSATQYETANEAYDPATDTWSTKMDMPTGRKQLAAAAVDGIIYAIGGGSSGQPYEDDNEAYDPATDSWTTKAAMPIGRLGLAAAAMDGIIYAIGGYSGIYPEVNEANEAYDPATDTWTTKSDMPTGRLALAAVAVDGIIYAIGGYGNGIYETANEVYDPTTDTWSNKMAMPTRRAYLAAAAVDGIIYAIGGESSSFPYEDDNEAYTPALYAYRKD
jgi:N-acetylneuraminic acid mutarotase